MRRLLPSLGLGLLLLGLNPEPGSAHKPQFSDSPHDARETAYVIEDLTVSIVVYHRVTCDTQQLWMTFDGEAGDELFFQLGLPQLDRLSDYRPNVAALAPGLPEPPDDLPFEVPEGMGAEVLTTADVEEPEAFVEEFTETRSWILAERSLTLPENGRGFVVAWPPDRRTGKLWVSTGTEEEFGEEAFENLETWRTKTRKFHEVGEHEPETPPEEEVCPAPSASGDASAADGLGGPDGRASDEPSGSSGGAGCESRRAPVGWAWWALALPAWMAARRGRRAR